ncbi:AMP-binding protein [Sphingobacterium pedocola]|uniref:AMP-dependent synthetase n=1 Tax=Sphingobacterium pedocola TaxID=2082722 RepID=A0ABR9T587_9SPHI|nr:AMP-binding protein [Sphingobacterium pedocola]MBE8720244.1 AMP-dependent synthetase [Sphingobacterium pedocola]
MEKRFNITELFLSAAATYPDKVAIVDKQTKISFKQLLDDVKCTAHYFAKKGIQKGDRVLVFVPMGIDLYRIVLALFYMGATVVFLDEWTNRKRLDLCCRLADCKAFVGTWKTHLLRLFSSEIRRIPIILNTRLRPGNSYFLSDTQMEDPALITFTTGSTGVPKAALRTHGFLLEQFNALEDKMQAHPSDIDMSVLPIVLLINLGVGSTSVIADFKSSKPTKMCAARIIDQLRAQQVSRIVASPYFIKRLAEEIKSDPRSLPHLRAIFTGGAPVFQKEALLFTEVFRDKQVQIVYGSTEAEPISSIEAKYVAEDHITYRPEVGLCVGRPYSATQVRILKITDEALFDISAKQFKVFQCEEEEWGEIIVSGPHVLATYFKNEDALRKTKILLNGVYWHRTGDAGYMKDGMLYLTGRCQTLIQNGNRYISPFIFENYLQFIPGVRLGTVLKIQGKMIAFVELENKAVDRQLLEKTIRSLPLFIDEIRFCKLPRDPRHHSKIEYGKLAPPTTNESTPIPR